MISQVQKNVSESYTYKLFNNKMESTFFILILSYVAVILGEVANFAAYAFAPAILVTPLGALSIIFR
jgi:hypothetical protein